MKVQLAVAGSSVLYHITEMINAVRILKGDSFILAPTALRKTEIQHGGGKPHYFMSFARTPHNLFFKTNQSGRNKDYVIFVCDGQKLASNYKIKPVDFLSHPDSAGDIDEEWKGGDETEDRLITTKHSIPAIRYIKEIHFSSGHEIGLTQMVRALALTAKLNNIKIFRYESFGDLIKMNRRKALPLDMRKATPRRRFGQKKRDFGLGPSRDSQRFGLKTWWRALKMPVKPGDKQAQFMGNTKNMDSYSFREDIWEAMFGGEDGGKSDFGLNIARRRLGTMIDTGRADPYGQKLVEYMKRKNLQPAELFDQIRDRWK